MSFQWIGIVLFFLFSITTLNSDASGSEQTSEMDKLTILSTIKPIQLLVNEIVGSRAESALLIPATVNLHHYSLRPSDLRKISQADMVIRVSESMERFLTPLLKNKQHVLSLEDAEGISWLSVRGKHHSHDAHHEELAHENSRDYHFWLDPNHAMALVALITKEVTALAPSQQKYFEANSNKLKQSIQDANNYARLKLQPLKDAPYLTFHDSWHYFEQGYSLAEPHTVSLQEGLPPGIQTLLRLRKSIADESIHCLIADPNSNQKVIRTLTDGLSTNIVWLSPVGATKGLNNGINHYSDFIRFSADQFSACLAP